MPSFLPRSPPTREIRHQHVVAEVQLRLGQQQPAAGLAAKMEGPAKLRSEAKGSMSMRQSRPRRGVELAVEHLGHLVLRHANEIVVRGTFFQGLSSHQTSLTPARFERVNSQSERGLGLYSAGR
jgi:hypothetical protein